MPDPLPDDPAATSTPLPRPRRSSRPAWIVVGILVVVAVGAYGMLWVNLCRNGSYVIGTTDLDAAIAMVRSFDADLAGVTWTRREIKPDERRQSRKTDKSIMGGLVQRFTQEGTVEVIGTRDGERRFRVTVEPGPFGIGWHLASYRFRPPAPPEP